MPWEFEFTQDLLHLLVYCYHSQYTADFRYDNDIEERSQCHAFHKIFNETTLTGENVQFANCGLSSGHLCYEDCCSNEKRKDEQSQGYLSLWFYVANNISDFTNPIYNPSGRPSRMRASNNYVKQDIVLKANSGDACRGLASTMNMAAAYFGGVTKSCSDWCDRVVKDDNNFGERLHHDKKCTFQDAKEIRGSSLSQKIGTYNHEARMESGKFSFGEDVVFRERKNASENSKHLVGALEGLTIDEVFEPDSSSLSASDEVAAAIASAMESPLSHENDQKVDSPVLNRSLSNRKKKCHVIRRRKIDENDGVESSTSLYSSRDNARTTRWVHLLTPHWEVNELLLWEAAHFNGLSLPGGVKLKMHASSRCGDVSQCTTRGMGVGDCSSGVKSSGKLLAYSNSFSFTTAASPTLAYERGLYALCRQQQRELQNQEREISRLKQQLAGFESRSMGCNSDNYAHFSHSNVIDSQCNDRNDLLNEVDVDEDDFAEFVTPHRRISNDPTCSCSDNSMHSKGHDCYSNSISSTASSLFQRHFRFQNPATLLFSPPLLTPPSTAASKGSSAHSFSSSSTVNITPPYGRTPPTGNSSTALATTALHQKRYVETSPAPSSLSSLPCQSVKYDGSDISTSTVNSCESAHVSIMATATLLEDHYE